MLRLDHAGAMGRHRLAGRRVAARGLARRVVAQQAPQVIAQAAERLRLWLVEQAFPVWAERGAAGADEVCVLALAGRLGWQGPWERLVREGLAALLAGGVEDGEPMARTLGLAGAALGLPDVAAMGLAMRARVGRAGATSVAGLCADRTLAGFGRWQMYGATADLWEVLAGVAELEAAGDLWACTRVAAALLGEDRLWLYP